MDAAWTMKFFFKDGKGMWLEPANKRDETIRPKCGLAVEGVVGSVIRNLV